MEGARKETVPLWELKLSDRWIPFPETKQVMVQEMYETYERERKQQAPHRVFLVDYFLLDFKQMTVRMHHLETSIRVRKVVSFNLSGRGLKGGDIMRANDELQNVEKLILSNNSISTNGATVLSKMPSLTW